MPKLSRLVALVLLLFLEIPQTSQSQPSPLHSWQLISQHHTKSSFKPLAGSLPGRMIGPVSFAKKKPHALQFVGDVKVKQHLIVSDDVNKAELPQQTISAEAWVKVDRVQDWCGFVGLIQDNGSYEKGWLLGFNKGHFFFAVSSEKTQRLTYLKNPAAFTPGYWYQVLGTYDGKEQKLYVDGKLVATSKHQQGAIHYPPQGIYCIGAYRDDNEFYPLQGEIEQVSVWKEVLSAQQVKKRFESRKSQFPIEEVVSTVVKDWPTYLHDNERSGLTTEEVLLPLALYWDYDTGSQPRPAWPMPAKQDFWHNKYDLKARVTYDHGFQPVVANGKLFYGSSDDDAVHCLTAKETPSHIWSFFTEGPVRLAPTIAGDRVLFGSDDGHVYCVKAQNGELLWKTRIGPTNRRIPGNERIISVWPIRTGVLVEDNTAFCCAGVFPEQGVYQAALDARTGKILAKNKIGVSAQGYLMRHGNKLFVATGRNPAGAFIADLKRKGKGNTQVLNNLPRDYPYAFIGTPTLHFAGGDSKVAAFSVKDGQQVWSAPVKGKAHSLVVAGGLLYAGTDEGHIYCFGPEKVQAKNVEEKRNAYPHTNKKEKASWEKVAEQIIRNASVVTRGYALILGGGEGQLAYELVHRTDLHVVMVHSDPVKVDKARDALQKGGVYGTRVVVHHIAEGQPLPYTDYLFNLVVLDSEVAKKNRKWSLSDTSLERLIRPFGGVGIDLVSGKIVRRGPLANVGEWSHFYGDPGNTACSMDKRVQGQMQLQWFGGPGPREMIDRHHRTVAPLWKAGRLFIPGNNRVMAVDAYNGFPLWDVEIPDSRRVGAFRDCSYLVATDDLVYVAAKDKCFAFHAETGRKEITFTVPKSPDTQPRHWGYLASVNDWLIGSFNKPGASRTTHDRGTIADTYYDARPLVGSEGLFVMDRHGKGTVWRYFSQGGLIINPAIAIGERKIFFVESNNLETRGSKNSRATPPDLLGKGSSLVALDLKTGKELWRKTPDFRSIQHLIYLMYAQEKVVVVGSKNSGTGRSAKVLFDIAVFEEKTGSLVWSHTQKQPTGIGGSHGEQDHHPVIVADKLYCEPFGYHLHTGKPLSDFGWIKNHRRGCGTISASATSFFFRQSNPTMFDLLTNRYAKVTSSTRPGCWINMIPAGGLLLIPEASSGCTCNYSVQTSLAFLPVATAK